MANASLKIWKLLPLGPAGYGDSPSQCFSAFAGNPLLIHVPEEARAHLVYNEAHSGAPWTSWEREASRREPESLGVRREKLKPAIERCYKEQQLFFAQFDARCRARTALGFNRLYTLHQSHAFSPPVRSASPGSHGVTPTQWIGPTPRCSAIRPAC